jgi:hypothetical protein
VTKFKIHGKEEKMEQLIKHVFIQDILESLEAHNSELNIVKDGLQDLEDKIALYANVEKRLGSSEDDSSLRKYILKRVDRWKSIVSEDKQKIQETEDTIRMLESIQNNIQKRNDDLSL